MIEALASIDRPEREIQVRHQNGSFKAIRENPYLEIGGNTPMETRQPILICSTSEVERLRIVKDDRLDVGDDLYHVRKHEPDGTGMSRILLVKK